MDMEKVKQEMLQNIQAYGSSAKEFIYEFLYNKTMAAGESLFSEKVQDREN